MGIFSKKPRKPWTGLNSSLRLERLEDRLVPSGNVISGFVFHDANNNGLFETGESPIANNPIELRNAQGVVVATATTDAAGLYQFTHDNTLSVAPTILTRTADFPATQTNFVQSGLIDQFDPALGQLTSVEIIHEGSITSAIHVENTSPSSGSTISGTVSGHLSLTGPGVSLGLNLSDNAGSYSAGTFDGAIDFGGGSGNSFAPKTVVGSKSITLTGSGMQAFLGTGKVTFTEAAQATSQAAGGGNLIVSLLSSGTGKVTVKYNYVPSSCLKPGDYTIVQVMQPAGFLDGKEASGGVALNHPPGVDAIAVTLANADSAGNNFGELQPARVAGNVYIDVNNNGQKDGPETGIPGVSVTLTGNDDLGPINKIAVTDASGAYQFAGLRPGSYSVSETQPSGFLDGRDTIGTISANVANDLFAAIALSSGAQSLNNNFGELLASSLSGFVFVDSDNDGVKDPGEQAIAGAQVNLTGSDDTGPVNLSTTTNASGLFQFSNLRPGTYTLSEIQPTSFLDGKDAAGSQGGALGNDQISGITLQSGVQGDNNNFGEIDAAGLSGSVFADGDNDGVKDASESGIPGVTVNLTGADDLGATVNRSAITDANGLFQFTNLRPGTYSLSETQPANFLDGKDSAGSLGGSTANDLLGNIGLPPGSLGQNYNFAELPSAGLSGFVFSDDNKNGLKDPGEAGIAGVQIDLDGTDDFGLLTRTQATDASGFYRFANLRPGTYTLTETQPAGFDDGSDAIGSQGGTAGDDQFSNIVLFAGVLGADNNFGEILAERADLSIVKTSTPASVVVGATFTYELTITNLGDFTAKNVTVTDTLPAETTFLTSAPPPGWTSSVSGQTITFSTTELPVGATPKILVTVRAPQVAGFVTNSATVSAMTPDDELCNNHSQVITTVFNQPGDTFPSVVVPPPTTFNHVPVISKNQLFSSGAHTYVDATAMGNYAFVDGVFRSLTGTSASNATILPAARQLQSGTLTRSQLVASLWNSDQHRVMQANKLFQVFHHRPATASERAAVVSQLKAGVPETDIAVQFLTSAEYQQSHPTLNSFMLGFYQDMVGQVGDLSAPLQLVQSMNTTDRVSVARALMNRPETLQQIVKSGFQNILGRQPTSAELSLFTSRLQANQVSPAELMRQLLASDEFFARAKKAAGV